MLFLKSLKNYYFLILFVQTMHNSIDIGEYVLRNYSFFSQRFCFNNKFHYPEYWINITNNGVVNTTIGQIMQTHIEIVGVHFTIFGIILQKSNQTQLLMSGTY